MKNIKIITTLLLLSVCLNACGTQPDLPLTDAEITEIAAEETTKETAESTGNPAETSENSDQNTEDMPETLESETQDTVLTMQDIIEANEISTLLNRYDTIQCEMVWGEYEQTIYADNDILCYLWSDGWLVGIMDGRRCETDDYGYQFVTSFYLGIPDESEDAQCLTLGGFFSGAEITATTEENGLLYVTAQLSERDSAYILLSADYEVLRGDTAVMQYTLRADDMSMIEYIVDVQHADGSAELLSTFTMTYNTDRPMAANMLYEHMSLPDIRTVTLIVNPDTDAEYTLSTVGIQGDRIQFYSRSDSDYDIRVDRYQDTDRAADIEIYGFDKDRINEFYH